MKILALDLELNQAASGAKIIEIGACIGDIQTGTVLERYSAFVNPHEALEEMIIKLTTITQAQVDAAGTIEEAYLGMVMMAKQYDCLRMPLVWGAGDTHAIKKELPPTCTWKFGRRELDAKTIFQAYQMALEQKVQAGLAKAMTRLDLQFRGTKHRAVDDAVNTFVIFCELLKRFKLV
jgi:inhibitor of KinA sporulation pathway (predicted exonuclease)